MSAIPVLNDLDLKGNSVVNLSKLQIYNSLTDGSEGVKVSSFKPSIILIDRTGSTYSFRWAADANYMRLEPDNADNGATWQSGKFYIDSEGRVLIGQSSASSSVGLYVRPQILTGVSQYGIFSNPVFDETATTNCRGVFSSATLPAYAVTIPRMDSFSNGIPTLKTLAVDGYDQQVTWINAYVVNATAQSNVLDFRAIYSSVSKVAGTARWNLYFNGDAPSYHVGSMLLGSVTDNLVDKLQVTGSIHSTVGYKVAGNQVVGARETGWTAASGAVVANKGAYAPAIVAAAVAAPTKAEFDAAVTALNLANGRIKALEAALRTHGLIV